MEVTRNRTTPFWSHPALRPLNSSIPSSSDTSPHAVTAAASVPASRRQQHDDQADESDEELAEPGLEYQRKFGDSHMLDTVGREGASFFRLIDQCLSRESRDNSTQSAAPVTWERSTANAMFYRTRPVQSDRGT
ncbi:hypothetical protein DFH09DRAFT_1316790 [Mycena vulgaris]|nr:hypothetical protein DFH09DRAFT_1316790 [Mycena vulgaris]